MQTGETRIRSKAMPPPNTNPMELDHMRVHVSNLSFIYDGSAMSCECPGEEEEPDRWFYSVGKVFAG